MAQGLSVSVWRGKSEGGFVRYEVPRQTSQTVLDVVTHIQRELEPSLAYRFACRVGMCGTCAISVNGIPRLACKTRPSQLPAGPLTLEPLPNLPVIRDLVVSMDPFFEQWKRVLPEFRPADPEATTLKSIPAASAYARNSPDKRDCITCGTCYAACGIAGTNQRYLGPAALNRAYLRILDPRDSAKRERLRIVDDERSGAWRCHTQFNCTAVCPKGISLTDSIVRLKRLLLNPTAVEKL